MELYKIKNKNQHIRQLGITLSILNILDIIFTKISFIMGSTEANPIMAILYTKWGFVGGLVMPKIILISIIIYQCYKFNHRVHNYKFWRNILYIGIVPYIALTAYHIINILFGSGII